jgi:acyl carrier protein
VTADVKQQVREYIIDNFLMGSTAQPIGDQTSFMENHILDSTGFIELVAFLEQEYGVTIEDKEMIPENLDSLANIERYVQRKAGA